MFVKNQQSPRKQQQLVSRPAVSIDAMAEARGSGGGRSRGGGGGGVVLSTSGHVSEGPRQLPLGAARAGLGEPAMPSAASAAASAAAGLGDLQSQQKQQSPRKQQQLVSRPAVSIDAMAEARGSGGGRSRGGGGGGVVLSTSGHVSEGPRQLPLGAVGEVGTSGENVLCK